MFQCEFSFSWASLFELRNYNQPTSCIFLWFRSVNHIRLEKKQKESPKKEPCVKGQCDFIANINVQYPCNTPCSYNIIATNQNV